MKKFRSIKCIKTLKRAKKAYDRGVFKEKIFLEHVEEKR